MALSRRDGGEVFCASRRGWIDLERCFRCPRYRSATDSKVRCANGLVSLFGLVSRGLPFAR